MAGPLFHVHGLTDRTHGKRHALISHKIELIHHCWLLSVAHGINHKAAPLRIKAPLSLKAYLKMEVQPGFIAFIMTLITPNGFSRMVECRESFLVQFFFSLLFTCPISQSKIKTIFYI